MNTYFFQRTSLAYKTKLAAYCPRHGLCFIKYHFHLVLISDFASELIVSSPHLNVSRCAKCEMRCASSMRNTKCESYREWIFSWQDEMSVYTSHGLISTKTYTTKLFVSIRVSPYFIYITLPILYPNEQPLY